MRNIIVLVLSLIGIFVAGWTFAVKWPVAQDPNDPPTVRELTNQMWVMQNTLDACCEQLTRPDGEFRESFEEYVRLRGQLHELELRVETLEGGPK